MNVDERRMSLTGTWAFALDDANRGVDEAWYSEELRGAIVMPADSESREPDDETARGDDGSPKRLAAFVGRAWYQRLFRIPRRWEGETVELFMERLVGQVRDAFGNHPSLLCAAVPMDRMGACSKV